MKTLIQSFFLFFLAISTLAAKRAHFEKSESAPLHICDLLPWNTPLGDCASGHTLDDMVEWPADFTTGARDIDPAQLEFHNFYHVDDRNLRPILYNLPPLAPSTEWTDETVQINDTTFLTLRTWKITDSMNGATYIYVQQITQIIEDRIVVCVESGNGDPITQIDLDLFQAPTFSNVQYNEDGCIELILNNLNDRFTFDGLGLETNTSGINVADLHIIQEIVLGENSNITTLQILAADITNDYTVSSSDIVALRKLILGKNDYVFWRLYDKNRSAEDQNNSFTIDINNRFHQIIPIKSGDLDFSCFSDRSLNEELHLKIEDQILNKGEYYTIPLILKENLSTRSIQMEFPQDELLFDQFTFSTLSPDNFTLPEDEFADKIVLLSYIGNVQHLNQGDTLVNIRFRAMDNGILSEMLTFHSDENNIAVMPIGQNPKEIVFDWTDKIINTNIQEVELAKISLFPNPASEYLEIKGISSLMDYQISDILGNVCSTGNIQDNTRLDLLNLRNGMYILTIKNSSAASKSFKFFVAK